MSDSGKTVFETPWFSIIEVPLATDPNSTYFSLTRPNGVICCVLTDKAELVLARQLRPPLGRTTLEMPAGSIDPGETPEQAVGREILEETGYVCADMLYVTPLRLMINRENVIEHFFMGLGARPVPGFVHTEAIDTVLISRADLRDLMLGGTYDQSVALSGIYIAEQRFGFRFFEDSADHILSRLRG
jgi:ADP-ribose pyrophosphatase